MRMIKKKKIKEGRKKGRKTSKTYIAHLTDNGDIGNIIMYERMNIVIIKKKIEYSLKKEIFVYKGTCTNTIEKNKYSMIKRKNGRMMTKVLDERRETSFAYIKREGRHVLYI